LIDKKGLTFLAHPVHVLQNGFTAVYTDIYCVKCADLYPVYFKNEGFDVHT